MTPSKKIGSRVKGQGSKGKRAGLDRLWLIRRIPLLGALLMFLLLFSVSVVSAEELFLQPLLDEALKNSPEILAADARAGAAGFKIPQAKSMSDPMFMLGYQNEGFKSYTYGQEQGAQWMFTASQTFPYPGKLPLKGEMAALDAEGFKMQVNSVRIRTVNKVRELYYDLFLAYKTLDIIKDKEAYLKKLEDAALARYSSGMAPVQDTIMIQSDKYMLLEREEMLRQGIQSMEAQLNSTLGRNVNAALGRPVEPVYATYERTMEDLIKVSDNSPEILYRRKMLESAETKVRMAEREYYPDFTVNAGYYARRGEFQDMWSLTTSFNIPIFYATKQRQAVNEAREAEKEAGRELESVRLMAASSVRENYVMMKSSEKLMDLYKNGLIPKTSQDFTLSLSGYASGSGEASGVIARLKALLDYELLYWSKFSDREKAAARMEAAAGITLGREEK